jgi:hypothetical protein
MSLHQLECKGRKAGEQAGQRVFSSRGNRAKTITLAHAANE